MPPLPVLSCKEAVKVFQSFGWEIVRQRGSHIMMVHDTSSITLSIPNHKEIAKGTLRNIITRCKSYYRAIYRRIIVTI